MQKGFYVLLSKPFRMAAKYSLLAFHLDVELDPFPSFHVIEIKAGNSFVD